MGYTHYWYRKKRLNEKVFAEVVRDFRKMLPAFSALGIPIAGFDGKGKPKITDTEIRFNGVEKCEHGERDLGITWPAEGARGIVCSYAEDKENSEQKLKAIEHNGVITVLTGNPLEWVKDSDVSGAWFAGAKLKSRSCGGDCSHETFSLVATFDDTDKRPRKDNLHFDFCKTAYKPYDLVVNVCLIIAKHYFGKDIIVKSDGELEKWQDAIELCQRGLGYGENFRLGDENADTKI